MKSNESNEEQTLAYKLGAARQSGRTTNMIKNAIDELQNGVPNIQIIAHSKDFALFHIKHVVIKELEARGEPYKVIERDIILVDDNQYIRLLSMHEDKAYRYNKDFSSYIDHAVYEISSWKNEIINMATISVWKR